MQKDKNERSRDGIDRMIRRWSGPKLDLLIERAKHHRKSIGGRPIGSITENKINNAYKIAARHIRQAKKRRFPRPHRPCPAQGPARPTSGGVPRPRRQADHLYRAANGRKRQLGLSG